MVTKFQGQIAEYQLNLQMEVEHRQKMQVRVLWSNTSYMHAYVGLVVRFIKSKSPFSKKKKTKSKDEWHIYDRFLLNDFIAMCESLPLISVALDFWFLSLVSENWPSQLLATTFTCCEVNVTLSLMKICQTNRKRFGIEFILVNDLFRSKDMIRKKVIFRLFSDGAGFQRPYDRQAQLSK